MNTRILLVFPMSFEANSMPPLGMSILAACLQKAGCQVDLLDLTVEPDKELDWNKYAIIGMTMLCNNFKSGIRLAKRIKERNNNIVIVAGGPFADTCPQEVLESGTIDIVLHGEGEKTFVKLVQALEGNENLLNIPGLSFYREDEIIHTGNPVPINNLDELPLPAYDLLPLEKYFQRDEKLKITTIMSSRGCPYQCVFCTRGPAESRIMRFHSPERVIEWIKLLVEDLGSKHILFVDSTFTVNKKHAEKICDLIIESNLKFEWSCMTRVDCIDRSLLEKMKSAGCTSICAGIESGNDEMLDLLKKGFKKDDAESAAQLFKDVGGPLLITAFIIGHPWDTKETIRDTGKFARKLQKKYNVRTSFFLMVPFPGTDFWNNAEDWGVTISKDWDNFSKTSFKDNNYSLKANFSTKYFSQEELTKQYRKTLNRYGKNGIYQPLINKIKSSPRLYQIAKTTKNVFTDKKNDIFQVYVAKKNSTIQNI